MILFYVRHGQPIYDPDQLTPLGLRQAESVARRLCQYGVDSVFASTSNRAIQTAQPTCDILRLKPTLLDWANEVHAWREMSVERPGGGRCWCYVEPDMLRLLSSEEVRSLGPRWHEHPAFEGRLFGQGVERVRREADAWLASLGYVHDSERHLYRVGQPNDERRIALFAHEGAGMLLLSALLDIPYPLFSIHFTMGHTGVTAIEFRDLGGWCIPCVLQLSNDSHLYRDGLPTRYQDRLRF